MLLLTTAVCAATAFAGTPGSPSKDGTATLVRQARAARAAGDLSRASRILKRAYQASKHPAVLNNLATVYVDMGRYQLAHDTFAEVVNTPEVPEPIKRRVRVRLQKLAPKLLSGWLGLNAPSEAANLRLWIDGVPQVDPRHEVPVAAGRHRVEVRWQQAGQRRALWIGVAATAGQRADVSVTASGLRQAVGAVQLVALPTAKALRLRVDGADLSPFGPGDTPETLYLTAGEHRLGIAPDGAARVTSTLRVGVGKQVRATWQDGVEPARKAQWRPWVMVGAGVIAAAIGGMLIGLSEVPKERLERALEGGGVVHDIQEVQAQALQSEASTLTVSGAISLGVGISLLLGGGSWAAVDALKAPPAARLAVQPP